MNRGRHLDSRARSFSHHSQAMPPTSSIGTALRPGPTMALGSQHWLPYGRCFVKALFTSSLVKSLQVSMRPCPRSKGEQPVNISKRRTLILFVRCISPVWAEWEWRYSQILTPTAQTSSQKRLLMHAPSDRIQVVNQQQSSGRPLEHRMPCQLSSLACNKKKHTEHVARTGRALLVQV